MLSTQFAMPIEEKQFHDSNGNYQGLNHLPEMIYQQNFKFIGDTWVRETSSI